MPDTVEVDPSQVHSIEVDPSEVQAVPGPSIWQRALTNAPRSLANLALQTPGIPREGAPDPTLKRPEERTPEEQAEVNRIKSQSFVQRLGELGGEFAAPAVRAWEGVKKFAGDPIGTARESFAENPAGTLALPLQIGRMGGEVATSAPARAAGQAIRAVATKPAVLKTGGAAVGGTVGHMTGIPGGGVVGAMLGREAGGALADRLNAVPQVPPEFDDIAKGLGGTNYASLSPAGQETVQRIHSQMAAGAGKAKPLASYTAAPDVPARTGRIDIGEPAQPRPGQPRTVEQAAQEFINQRKAAASGPQAHPLEVQPHPLEAGRPLRPAPQAELEAAQPIPRAETLKPDVAAGLGEGATRVNPLGGVERLERIPMEKIKPAAPTEERPQGNVIHPEVVQHYVDNPSPVAPELRLQPNGSYETYDGHHRIEAAKQRGETDTLAWTSKPGENGLPEVPAATVAEAAAAPPLTPPEATPAVPPPAASIPPGPPPEAYLNRETTGLQVAPEMANRAAKAQRFIVHLKGTQNLPLTQAEWVKVAADMGEKTPSFATQQYIRQGLNQAMREGTEQPGKVQTIPEHLARNPKALKIAQQLVDMMNQ